MDGFLKSSKKCTLKLRILDLEQIFFFKVSVCYCYRISGAGIGSNVNCTNPVAEEKFGQQTWSRVWM